MRNTTKILLLVGDLASFIVALWLTLLVRYQELPGGQIFGEHLGPFSVLFILWLAVFLIAGLYDTHLTLSRKDIPRLVLKTQTVNLLLAAVFFFAVPADIAPKTNLFIYLIISSLIVTSWRLFVFPRLSQNRREGAVIIGTGKEIQELEELINESPRHTFRCVGSVDPATITNEEYFYSEMLKYIENGEVSVIIADTSHYAFDRVIEPLYDLAFLPHRIEFIDVRTAYENVFNRIPLSLIDDEWFLSNISNGPHVVYDVAKRAMDIIGSVVLIVLSLPLYLLARIMIKFDDDGPLFIDQERVGQYNKPVEISKFRSMTGSDKGKEVLNSTLRITKAGAFLRKTRIDEFPQLISVLKGDLSFVGPRPELPALATLYAQEIPYYNMRHLIKPGLSGWAQIYHEAHPHHGTDVEETAMKLSYDLYYLKHRSFLLDIEIALKTIKTLFSRSGA